MDEGSIPSVSTKILSGTVWRLQSKKERKVIAMFKSLLNVVSVDSLILDVFIILAVVVAGSLIFYFLWEAMTTILANRKDWKREPKQKKDEELKFEDDKNSNLTSFDLDKKEEPVEEPVEAVVAEEAQEEEKVEEEPEVLDETKLEEVNEEQAETEGEEAQEEISEEERANAERRAYLEARRQELLRRMQEENEDEAEEAQGEETEEVAEETTEEVAEEAEPVDALAEERAALLSEKTRYEAMVAELEKAKAALAAEQEPAPASPLAGLSLDELKARLADAEERLKVTEKEFKQCKKEYIPLHKVWATHEKDEKKLRRKEALVARQKVLLYGVNNYADIDEEKAKKLSEDLDLLDGLKLSVQHCEEVMKNNEERYPLLEKMYNVLKDRDEEIRADIERLTAEIERLEAENE